MFGGTLALTQDLNPRLAGLREQVLDQPRWIKRIVLAANDVLLLGLAAWLAFSLRWGYLYWPPNAQLWIVLLAAPMVGVPIFQMMSLYRLVTRYIGRRGAVRIASAVALAVLVWTFVVIMVAGTGDQQAVVPRSVPVIYAVLAGLFVWASREIAAWCLSIERPTSLGLDERKSAVIYGAGPEGAHLLEALHRAGEHDVVGFIDADEGLIGQTVNGIKVYRIDKLAKLVERENVKDVLLALPDQTRRQRQEIIRQLASHPVRVRSMPAARDIASGRVSVTDLKADRCRRPARPRCRAP